MTRRWTLRLVAGLAAGAVVLSGCSERQEASDTLPGADASPSASEPELPPLGPPDLPMPDEARTQDAAGVERFTRYYLRLINRTSRAMETEHLRSLSDGCETCDRIAADTEADAAAGYRYEGGEVSIQSAAPATVSGSTGHFAFIANQAALNVVDSTGSPVEGLSFPALEDLSSGAAVRWDSGRHSWLMTQLTLG